MRVRVRVKVCNCNRKCFGTFGDILLLLGSIKPLTVLLIKPHKTTTKMALPAALGQRHQNGLLVMGVLSKARVKNRRKNRIVMNVMTGIYFPAVQLTVLLV